MKMGLQELIPSVEDQDGAELATQSALAELQQRLTGTLKEPPESEPFVSQHQRVQFMG